MIYFQKGGKELVLTAQELEEGLYRALEKLGKREKVLIIPPDITRIHSKAGEITDLVWAYYQHNIKDILPALGTHQPMTVKEITGMFRKTPLDLFRKHDFRKDVIKIGQVPADFVKQISEGKFNESIPVEVNQLLKQNQYDLILSIGQVVPHEVAGMANYNKNIFVGVGGEGMINKSHFLGAVSGMEKIMGKPYNPVREVFQYAEKQFLKNFPLVYVLTVLGYTEEGKLVMRGLFIGDDKECFSKAASLSQQINLTRLAKPLPKVVVYLDPEEYRSTWLGNKAIYRTRMAMQDEGELIILAPGIKEFGEDTAINRLIKKFGYHGTDWVIKQKAQYPELSSNLSAAAHLIHGSTEGRFRVTYCPGALSKHEIESVGYNYGDLSKFMKIYKPEGKRDGYYTLADGQSYFFISNPGLGLWAVKDRFNLPRL
ncbi:MAG: lactate racemase domain-containing protein [Spirochaetes bacterium]|nr:lactate racemase domain-containing protein [Spirochaetota bacterium]